MPTDLTFITNEEGRELKTRFSELIKDTRYFDCLVGYFYASGFHALYKSLENTEKIRILIGISTDKTIFDMIEEAKDGQQKIYHSHKETKELFSTQIVSEMEHSQDTVEIEDGIHKFIEWIRAGKLEIKVYPSEKIHAKIYIMTFKEGDRDKGRVITGSSNFTKAGLSANLEFNVELKNPSDYDFALAKFNQLWENAIDVSEKFVETINRETWFNSEITPFELYLKFLYEYLKDKINLDQMELLRKQLPENFMDLQYQRDAVTDAKSKLDEYGGVFLSDVVGLGKTYIAAMLVQQLEGRTLVIAPPILLDKDNPGSWPNVFVDFGIAAEFESLGKLHKLIERGVDKYSNVVIDEAHRFRTESTQMYAQLFEICRGKRVVLVSATPLNNTPLDILSQIKLFQNAHRSTLPNPKVRDLERYFKVLQAKLDNLHRQDDKEEYLKIIQENAASIRENVLKYLMVRRTRGDIKKNYGGDLKEQKLKFPEVMNPEIVGYYFDEDLDKTFNRTLELVIKEFKYSRYTPLLYLKDELPKNQQTPQRNMSRFMRILLVKRLESSFYAFKMSVDRFIQSHQRFIEEFKKGNVFVSSKNINKVFELLDNDDSDAIQHLIDSDDLEKYAADEFKPEFIKDLEHDLKLLLKIQEMWSHVTQDPKLDKFIEILSHDEILKKHKILVFTESKETVDYLFDKLNPKFDNKVQGFSSMSGEAVRSRIINNFDANKKQELQQNDIRILISTDILSEGVSLHRSNVVINYDIPWNPVRMMQRVGRVNRVSKNPPFDHIYTYNFFPAGQINDSIGLKEAAESKVRAFIEMLGNDAVLLTDEEIKTHDLFRKLTTKELLTGEDQELDQELQYLSYLRRIRDNDKELYDKIKHLPKKARTAREYDIEPSSVITFFRKGKLRKIFQTIGDSPKELDFITAAKMLETPEDTPRIKLQPDFYEHLEVNKHAFNKVFDIEPVEDRSPGTGYESKLTKRIKAIIKKPEFTDEEEEYLQSILGLLAKGGIPKAVMKNIWTEIQDEDKPMKILARIKVNVSANLFVDTIGDSAAVTAGPREIVLSEYLRKSE